MKIIYLMVIWLFSVTVSAQSSTAQRIKVNQSDIEKKAKMKIEAFQENCRDIGNVRISYAEKTAPGGIIEMALSEFMPDAHIRITGLDGISYSDKPVKKYLYRLAGLARDHYREIWISSFDCAIAEEFTKEANSDWYVGYVKIIQRFTADTKEGYRVSDMVERHVKVYARKKELQTTFGKNRVVWDVKLGDISARNID